ncbi:MAG TPA: CoA transferase [Candidatus Binataceae bacterium]|nr:CoA transferase [Candidatus Binataceae bacterium]
MLTTAGPLAGLVRVLDLSERSPAAAIAGMVLADLGAEVIRVEPVGGDPLRALAGSRVWLRGQESVIPTTHDIATGGWQRLLASADVILNTAHSWTQKPASFLDYPRSDRQIAVTLTAYPRSTAALAADLHAADAPVYGELIEAQYGLQHVQEGMRGAPIFLGWPHAVYGAAWMLQLGILGALLERERTGQGQFVTTSLLDGIAILSNARWVGGNAGGALMPGSRISTRHNNLRIVVELFQCADGRWIQVHTGPRGAFDRMLKLLGRDDIAVANADPHSLAVPLDATVAHELWAFLDRTFKSQPSDYWCDLLAKNDVCCMPALKPGDALWLDQMEANGLVDVASDGTRSLGRLAKFSRTPITLCRDIPSPGQDNARLLTDTASPARAPLNNGVDANRRANNGATIATPRVGPLDGILVLDFGAYMAGPFANRLFADLGARVIKVEEYSGDPMRGPQLSILLGVQRGKESLAIDLKSADGRRIVHDLVRRADVVHNNMRAGAMDRLGVGWDNLRALNPRLIYCHSSGYGNDGPWSRLPTFEPLHSAITGLLTRTGGESNPPMHYLTHMDYGCGLTSATMVLAALFERERSGLGQYLEVPQTGAGLLAMSDVHGTDDRKAETFPLDDEQRGHAPTNALYRTAGGWILIACYSDREWNGVRRALALSDSAWPSFSEARNQCLGVSAIARLIETALAKLLPHAAERRLRAENVPCIIPMPFTPDELAIEPSLREHGIILQEDHPAVGSIFEVGHTLRFSTATSLHRRPAPLIGQHSLAILHELGRSDEEIERLVSGRVVNIAGRSPAHARAGTRS